MTLQRYLRFEISENILDYQIRKKRHQYLARLVSVLPVYLEAVDARIKGGSTAGLAEIRDRSWLRTFLVFAEPQVKLSHCSKGEKGLEASYICEDETDHSAS